MKQILYLWIGFSILLFEVHAVYAECQPNTAYENQIAAYSSWLTIISEEYFETINEMNLRYSEILQECMTVRIYFSGSGYIVMRDAAGLFNCGPFAGAADINHCPALIVAPGCNINDSDNDGIPNQEDLNYIDTKNKGFGITVDNCQVNRDQNLISK